MPNILPFWLVKDVLMGAKKKRRIVFYSLPPSQESCYQYVQIEPKLRELAELHAGEWQDPIVSITFPTAPPNISTKIVVWKEVYQVPSRVEEYVMTHFCERLAGDLNLAYDDDFDDFKLQLHRAKRVQLDVRMTEWKFWLHRLYVYLGLQDENYLRSIWSLLQWKLSLANENDMIATFG